MSGVLIGTSAPMLTAVREDTSILLSLPVRALSSLVSGVLIGLECASRAAGGTRRWRRRLGGCQRPARQKDPDYEDHRRDAHHRPALYFRHLSPPSGFLLR